MAFYRTHSSTSRSVAESPNLDTILQMQSHGAKQGGITAAVELLATALLIKPRMQLAFIARAHYSPMFNTLPTRMPMSFSTELLSIQSVPQTALLPGATAAQIEFLQDVEIPFNSIPSAYQCSISHLSPQKLKVFSSLTSTLLSPQSI